MRYLDQFGQAKLTGTGACVFTEVTAEMNVDDIFAHSPCTAYVVNSLDESPLRHFTVQIGVSPSGKAPGFDLGIRWFESSYPCHLFHL